MPYYAVQNGYTPGIYNSWNECESNVKGYSQAKYKKFDTKREAMQFVNQQAPAAPYANPVPTTSRNSSSRQRGKYTAVYTDGCCLNNGYENATAGVGVYWGPKHANNVSQPLMGYGKNNKENIIPPGFSDPYRPTNNKAEIKAAHVALQQAEQSGVKNLKICTDSKYLVNAVTEWVPKWKQNNWINSSGLPVKNKIEFQKLDENLSNTTVNVKWAHVKGHSGVKGNEAADRLAKLGAMKSSKN